MYNLFKGQRKLIFLQKHRKVSKSDKFRNEYIKIIKVYLLSQYTTDHVSAALLIGASFPSVVEDLAYISSVLILLVLILVLA